MNVKNNTPDIRFNGFSGNWELKPLENIFARIRNAFVGTATPYYVKKGHFYLESNNIKNGLVNRNTEVFIDDEFHLKQKDKWLKTGDIVMVQSGHVGHSAVIPKELNNTAAHALIMFTDRKQATNPYFLNYQFSNENTKLKIDKITTGNTIKHILSSDMKVFECYFPVFEEQNTIGSFFQNIDENIGLSRRKHEKTKAIKKAFLSKMFPKTGKDKPEIRLKGFSGDWVERKLEEILLIRNAFVDSDNYIVDIELENIESQTGMITGDTSVRTQASSYFAIGDVLFGRLRPYLKKWWLADVEGVKSGEIWAFYSNNIKSEFIYSIVQTNAFMNATNVSSGSKMPRADWSSMSQATIRLPILKEEQTAIGQFFKQMDDTLALQAKQLEALETLKKALLAKMFV